MLSLTENWTFGVATILFGALAFVYLLYKQTYWERNGFKVLPGRNCLFGHFKETVLRRSFIGDVVTALYNSTNEAFIGIYGIFCPVLLVRDPALIRSILIKDFAHFTDRGIFYDETVDALTANLFGLPGKKWTNLRTKLNLAFTSSKLKAMFPTILDCGKTLQNHLNEFIENNELLDVRETTAGYTTNVIASVIFGIDADAIANPNDRFRICGRYIFSSGYINAIRWFLIFNAPKLMSFFRIKMIDSRAETFIRSITQQNLIYREKNGGHRNDLFQLLVELRNTGTVRDYQWNCTIKDDEKQKTLTFDQIAAQTFVFFLAGYESSSITLTCCLYELAKNPDVQKRVHDEIDDVLMKHNGTITYESISEMNYMQACLDETLRKYPVLPNISRICVKEYRIPGTTHVLEKGMRVLIPALALQMDGKYYDEPEKFIPDRFNAENTKDSNLLNRPFLTFGDGPRHCIGIRLSKLQTKIGLLLALQHFRYELTDAQKNTSIKFDPNSFTIAPVDPIKLHIFKR